MKRVTKKQKEQAEKAALRRRVLDMAFGAFGWYIGAEAVDPDSEDHTGMFGVLSPDAMGRWMGAVAIHLLKEDRDAPQSHLLKPHCLSDWDSLDGVVESLYSQGIRA